VESGTRLRVAGEGGSGFHGGRRRSVHRSQRSGPPHLGRQGSDIVCEVPITFVQAALGRRLKCRRWTGRPACRFRPAPSTVRFSPERERRPSRTACRPGRPKGRHRIEVPRRLSPGRQSSSGVSGLQEEGSEPGVAGFWRRSRSCSDDPGLQRTPSLKAHGAPKTRDREARGPKLISYRNGFQLLFVPSRSRRSLPLTCGCVREVPPSRPARPASPTSSSTCSSREPRGARLAHRPGGRRARRRDQRLHHVRPHRLHLGHRQPLRRPGLDILFDAVLHSSFDPRRLSGRNRWSWRRSSGGATSPTTIVRLLFSQVFTVHPYGLPVIGNEAPSRLTSADCLSFVRRWYRPGAMTSWQREMRPL